MIAVCVEKGDRVKILSGEFLLQGEQGLHQPVAQIKEGSDSRSAGLPLFQLRLHCPVQFGPFPVQISVTSASLPCSRRIRRRSSVFSQTVAVLSLG